jgi:tRNA 2-thiouridine synthesizing protein A
MDVARDDIARTLDMTGFFCPEPVVRTSNEIGDIAVGEVLEMLADDPSARSDMESWSKRTGHELVSVEEEDGVLRFLIRRTS